MRKLKAAELVLDFDLYPRNNVDSTNVRHLVEALASGAELPPIVIDRKSKRVTDGFHRTRAHIQFYGEDCVIAVIEKDYKNEKEMFLDAIRYNASHGAKLDSCDRTHCVIIAERLSIPIDAVAGALHIPVEKLGSLSNDRTGRNSSGLSIPLKRTIRHFAGKQLTKRQEEVNTKLTGLNQATYANQLIDLIESKLIDYEDAQLFERLVVLRDLLDGVLEGMLDRKKKAAKKKELQPA